MDPESSMYFLRARYYDPFTGRFISRDPVKGSLTDPQSQNPYSYAINNPINSSDPSGEQYRELFIENLPTFTRWGQNIAQACQKFFSSPAGVRTSQELGKEGEAAAGIIKNTQKIRTIANPLMNRIPDELSETQRVIGEIKNTQYQPLTNQLKDYLQYAQEKDYVFKLYTRSDTKLSQPLQDLIDNNQITHVTFP